MPGSKKRTSSSSSKRVQIFEVGPRDGLQNESVFVPFKKKKEFVDDLLLAGARDIEVGAFVRSDRVVQMKDSARFFQESFARRFRRWVLVPNERGLEKALEAGAKHIAVFTAATDGFNRANIGMSVKQSLSILRSVIPEAIRHGAQVRGYVSTAVACPFDGKTSPAKAARVAMHLLEYGAFQISMGDTIGVGTPREIEHLFERLIHQEQIPPTLLAGHFHDTFGMAIANTLRAYDLGIRTFDASAGGLGGCPFAPGATGNLATEDLIYLFNGMKVKTGLRLEAYCKLSLKLARYMKRPVASRTLQAMLSKRSSSKKKSKNRSLKEGLPSRSKRRLAA